MANLQISVARRQSTRVGYCNGCQSKAPVVIEVRVGQLVTRFCDECADDLRIKMSAADPRVKAFS